MGSADAVWAVRPDGSSQGGYVIFVASQSQERRLRVRNLSGSLWWIGLPAVCRGSLLAAATAVSG